MPTGSQDKLAHCLNMLLRVQAPDEQYLATVQHGSLLRAKFQFSIIRLTYMMVLPNP